ncbi:hypothetical protein Tco_0585162 [Tanacetum coccineum]
MAPIASSDTEVKTCSKNYLKNYEALKKQYDDLLVKLSDTDFKAATYKRGLATLEGQIVKYREHEVLFSEEIALLKRSVGSKEYQLGLLRTELEKVKQEKEGVDFKIAKPNNFRLISIQSENSKEPEVNRVWSLDTILRRILMTLWFNAFKHQHVGSDAQDCMVDQFLDGYGSIRRNLEDPSKQGRKIDLINEDHFCSDGCTNSREVRVQQRKRRIQRRVQQKQKDREDKVVNVVGEKVNAAESLLVVSTEVNAN